MNNFVDSIFDYYSKKNKMALINFNLILENIIPECKKRSLPSASKINFDKSVKINDFYKKFFNLLIKYNEGNEIFSVEKFKKNNFKLIYDLSLEVLKFYYTNESVLKVISKNSLPPFPNGNQIDKGDLLLLEDVFNKGKVYRESE